MILTLAFSHKNTSKEETGMAKGPTKIMWKRMFALMILVIFRPNLEDRIAIRALAKRTPAHKEMLQDGD